MPESTPVWGLPYPCSGETLDPAAFCEFNAAVDTALTTISDQAEFVSNRPNARISRNSSVNSFAVGVNTNAQFNEITYDNDAMADLGADNAALTIKTAGVYTLSFQLSGLANFTTWTRYRLSITQNGTLRSSLKLFVDVTLAIPTSNTISTTTICAPGDIIRGQFLWNGTGGPMVATGGALSASFICDL